MGYSKILGLTSSVSGQRADVALLGYDQLNDDVRELLFGDNPEPSLIDDVYRQQQYAVQLVGGNVWVSVVATSPESENPRVVAWLPPGFIPTGGGGRANWLTSASYLTTTMPVTQSGMWGWEVRSAGQSGESVTLDCYAIGVKPQ